VELRERELTQRDLRNQLQQAQEAAVAAAAATAPAATHGVSAEEHDAVKNTLEAMQQA
jgi:ribosomal protein L12E/L44/L45/RPP1/RPP2